MKKIIILLVFIFLSTGCYDYVELNNLAIIPGIAIDKIDDEYQVVFEILNTVNKEENPNEEKVYFVKGQASTISEAFLNASYEIPKSAYTAHVDTIVIDEEIATNNLKDIIDFLIRDIDVRNQFYLVISPYSPAEDIIKTTSTTNPVASTSIKDLIEQVSKKRNIVSELNFEKFLAHILGEHKDGYLTTISKDEDTLKIGPIAIFSDYKMQTILSNVNAANFNILNNSSYENTYKIKCPDNAEKNIVLATSIPAATETKIENQNVTFNINMEVKVVENHCNINFRNTKDLETIENILASKVQEEMNLLISELIKYNSDILEIAHQYYKQYRQHIDFRKLNYQTQVKVLINRNGLIFEVKE